MSSTPPPLGNRGSVPEATSVLLFTLVAGLLWYALVRSGSDTFAAERVGPPTPAPVTVTDEFGDLVGPRIPTSHALPVSVETAISRPSAPEHP